MVGADFREGVAFGGFHRFAVHPNLRQMPAFRWNKRIGDAFATVHRRLSRRRNRTLALDRSRQRVRVHRKGCMKFVVRGNIVERVAAVAARIGTVHKDGINVVAARGRDHNGGRIAVVHNRAGRRHRAALAGRRRHRIFVNGKICRNRMVSTNILE